MRLDRKKSGSAVTPSTTNGPAARRQPRPSMVQ